MKLLKLCLLPFLTFPILTQALDMFLAPFDPILKQVAEPITPSEITSQDVQGIIQEMLKIAYGEQQDWTRPVLVGLAAPQVGISKRIILVDVGADGKGKVSKLQVYINPEITSSSEEMNIWYEGCYSTKYKDGGIFGIVDRPKKIQVKAFNQKGEVDVEEHEGYIARIFQHEIDHLNGKEFTEHVETGNLHYVEETEMVKYRNNQGWRQWDKKVTKDEWNQIKNGSND